jgi:hypothetical protein
MPLSGGDCDAFGTPPRDHQKVDDFDDDIHNDNNYLKHSGRTELWSITYYITKIWRVGM